MPKKPFIPQQWEACLDENHTQVSNEVFADCTNDDVERIVSMIEQQGADIAPSYDEWVRLGFALVDDCGENGRGYFLRLSSLHAGCTIDAANAQYDKCLRSGNSGITISTFFHLAKQSGISISTPNGKMEIWQNGNLRDRKDKQNGTEISKSPNFQCGKMEKSEENEEANIQNAKYPKCQISIFPKWKYGHIRQMDIGGRRPASFPGRGIFLSPSFP